MKKLLVTLLSAMAISMPMAADSFTAEYNGVLMTFQVLTSNTCCLQGNVIEYDDYDDYETAISTNTTGTVTVPSEINGYTVTEIGRSAFSNCTEITKVVLPSTVTSLGSYAFYYCRSLTSIYIPSGVTYIPEECFSSCTSLSIISLPSNLTGIGYCAFRYCSGLSDVTIPNKVTYIGGGAFQGCNLARVNIPASVRTIQTAAFDSYHDLDVYVSDLTAWCNLSTADDDEYSDIFGSAKPHLYYNSYGSTGLWTAFSIPSGVTQIRYQAFSKFSDIQRIILPSSITSIQSEGLPQKALIVVPDGEKSRFTSMLGSSYRIYENSELKYINKIYYKVDAANHTASILDYYDEDYINEQTITTGNETYTVTAIDNRAFKNHPEMEGFKIPSTVTSIGDYAFQDCALSYIAIPKGVTNIGNGAFKGCNNLTSVRVFSTVPVAINNNTFSNRGSATLHVPAGSKDAYVAAAYWTQFGNIEDDEVPQPIIFADDNVKALCVANWDLDGDGELSTAEASEVTNFGDVFKNNRTITSFDELQYFTSLTSIGEQTFQYCTALTSVTIPSWITTIGESAFNNCTGLLRVNITDLEAWCNISFESPQANPLLYAHYLYLNGERIDDLVIPNSVEAFLSYTFRGGWFSSVTIPSITNFIYGTGQFGNSKIGEITLNTSVNSYSFYQATINHLIISPSMTYAGNLAFYEAHIENLEIPYSENAITWDSGHDSWGMFEWATIGTATVDRYIKQSFGSNKRSAFYQTNISRLTVGSHAGYSSDALCQGCRITDLYFDGITEISSNAFYSSGWSNTITNIHLPQGLTSIGNDAFRLCPISTVTIENETPIEIGQSTFSNRQSATLYVPYGSAAAYEAADGWKEFKEIIEMPAPEADIVDNAVLPWGTQQAWEMKYKFFEGTDNEPGTDGTGHAWYEVDYDDNGWQTLRGPIANLDNRFSTVNTIWNNEGLGSSSYCLRRTFHMDQVDEQGYTFLSQHDDDLKVWINGELVVDAGFDGTLQCHHIPASLFHEGENTLAISVNDFGGEAFLDYSLGRLFFLQNVETEKYLNAGNEWGTHAVLADEPLPVQLYKQLDGSYTIFFPVRSYNQHLLFRDEGKSNVFVDYNGQDAPASPYWTITDAGNGNYYIQMLNESDTYLGNDPDREPDNDVDGDVTSGKNITWTLVPEGLHTQAQAERLQELITQANALHIDTNKAQAVLDDENSTYTEMLAQILQVDGWINEGIWFEDEKVKELCVANWDTSEDGELSRIEAGTVADLGEVFKGNTEITSFNELQYFTGLTAIGDRAFSESSHLTSVQLPEGLERIGESAFDRTGLETIQFPSTLTSVGATAFQACENLTSIDFNGCTATIEGDAFSWCPSLTEVVIPSNITLTGWFTFAGCRNLKTLIIEEGNPSENLQATFAYCFDSSLETVVLPSTAIMGENMFEGCSKLKSVTFLNGDPGEKHFANNFQGVPDDVLFVIPEGTAENYLKRGYRNLSDKGALGKVRELFENQVNRISNDIVANVADGDKDALNAAISAAREIVETAEDYMTIYQQIDAIKDAAKAYLATAALTEDLDVTGAMITNPDNDYFDIGWTIGFLGMNNGWQNANYSNEDCTIDSFVESWRPGEALSDGRHSQTIKNLPAGKYRLDVKAIATWQDDPEQEVTGVSLFLGDQSTPLATANEKPQFFSVEFTNAETQDVEMGLKVENTTANWVALDDVRLYYLSDAVIEEPDNMLYVEETPSVLSGSKTELSISLKNEDAIIATDFYLQLPEGMSLDKVALNGSRSDGHQVTSQLNNDGYYHIVCYSSQNNAFKESDGELFCMTFSCASNVTAGTYQANVVNILMKDADKHNVAQPNFTISIEVPDLQLGDANEDRKIDIGDIVEVVDRIMQRPSETFNFAAANLHYDQKINALDLVVLVKLVLSQVVNQGAGPAPAMRKYLAMREAGLRRSSCADELHVADISIQPGESKPVSVELVNPDHAYNTIQFELALPSGLSIAKTSDDKFAVVPNPDRLTTDFALEVNEIGEGRYQFLVWTTNTEAVITGTFGELFAMTLTASADAETGMKQGVFSEQLFVIDEEGYEPADKTFNIRIGRLPGDANGDGYVTIADVMAVVNYILGNTPKNFDFDAANVNNDEVITIADAVSLVKMILEMP